MICFGGEGEEAFMDIIQYLLSLKIVGNFACICCRALLWVLLKKYCEYYLNL